MSTEHYIGPAPTNKELGITMVDEKQPEKIICPKCGGNQCCCNPECTKCHPI